MRRVLPVLAGVLFAATMAPAQDAASRAWQQRFDAEIPMPVPMVELAPANPFAVPVDDGPRLLTSTAPRRIDVSGRAVAAAYVNSKGECLGAVPLQLPFPGMTSAVVEELSNARFEPARRGEMAQPAWTVVEMTVEGRIKESEVLDQSLALPDPAAPPSPSEPERVAPSGNLVNLPATPADELTSRAFPRKLRLKVPDRDADVTMEALLHIAADGRCDQFVPLDVDSGLQRWLSAYLATWRLEPARRDGEAVDAWAIYAARVRIELSSLRSESFRSPADQTYTPE